MASGSGETPATLLAAASAYNWHNDNVAVLRGFIADGHDIPASGPINDINPNGSIVF